MGAKDGRLQYMYAVFKSLPGGRRLVKIQITFSTHFDPSLEFVLCVKIFRQELVILIYFPKKKKMQ